MNKKLKTWALRGLFCGFMFAFAYLAAQVATYTTLAQQPTTSPGGSLNLFSDFLGLAYNTDAHGTRQWIGPMFAMGKPPLTGWTNDNGGNFDTTYGYPYLDATRSSAVSLRFEYRTAPMGTYTCKALVYWDATGQPPGSGGLASFNTANGAVFGFRDGTGKIVDIRVDTGATNAYGFVTDKWTTTTNYSAAYLTSEATNFQPGGLSEFRNPMWIWWQDDGMNLNFGWSIDGNHLRQLDTRARTNFLASGPTQVGFGAYVNGADVEIAVPSWSCQ